MSDSTDAHGAAAAAGAIDPQRTAEAAQYQHERPLTACHWCPSGRFLFFGAEDHSVHRLELATGAIAHWVAHDSWVRALASSPDGRQLYSGGYDGRLIRWEAAAESPQQLGAVEAHQGWIRAVAASPDGRWLASCGNDRLVKLWNPETGELLRECQGHAQHVYNVAFAPDSSRLYSCDLKGVVREWPLADGEPSELVTVEKLHGYDTTFRADIGGARSIALRSDGAVLGLGGIVAVTNAFAGVGEVAVALVQLAERKLDRLLETQDKTKGTAWGLTHHPDGYWIAASGGGGGGWLWFWNETENSECFKLKLKNDGRGMSVAPDRRTLAVAHADKYLRTYSLS